MTTHEQWVESLGLPIHRGYYVEDVSKVEVGWWQERGCNAAFLQMVGFEEIGLETKVISIPAGKATLSWRFALDDIFYVVEGRGLATVWQGGEGGRKTFEWQKHSMFVIPRHSFCQLSNAQGDKPATLVSYNQFPFALRAVGDPDFFFNNPYIAHQAALTEDFYSEAKVVPKGGRGAVNTWYGNFFPDMKAWDKLEPWRGRGAGGYHLDFFFPNAAPLFGHMSVFPARTYKNAHYHGAGAYILIPDGEGYSVIWEKGHDVSKEGIVAPWHEGSCFAPQMYHQHFNVGAAPARYLVLQRSGGRDVEEPESRRAFERAKYTESAAERDEGSSNQIEYPDEDPWIRQTFEKELAKKGLTSLMPEEAYHDRNYKWRYREDKK